jgi:molybdenum cofactor sulfurtransferase
LPRQGGSAIVKSLGVPGAGQFLGREAPLDLVDHARGKGWDVLLDAAGFVPTNRLDLTAVQPDFVTVSFYKVFGYPTGVGALIVRHAALAKLNAPGSRAAR